MAPRLHSFQDKPDAVNKDAFLLILLLIRNVFFRPNGAKLSSTKIAIPPMKTNPGATLLKPAKPPDSNYESPALTAELQARRAATREHRTFNVQRPIFTARTGLARKCCEPVR